MSEKHTISFKVQAQTAQETDRLIGEQIRAYFGDWMNQAMVGPLVERQTEARQALYASGDVAFSMFETDVTVTIEFLGYR